MLLDDYTTRDTSGFVIIACKRIRQVLNIELLNYLSQDKLDDDIQFYMDQMPRKIYDREIDFVRADRIRKIANHYLSYRVYYSFSGKNIQEDLLEANRKENIDNNRDYDFIFIWESDNLIEDYSGFIMDLQKLDINKVSLPCYCKIRDFNKFLEDYIEYGEIIRNSILEPKDFA